MARPNASPSDKVGEVYVSVASTDALERMRGGSNILTALGVGHLTVAELVEAAAEETGSNTPGAFYKRWNTIDSFNKHVRELMIKTAFEPERRLANLHRALLNLTEDRAHQELGFPGLVDWFTETYTELVTQQDDLALVRWHGYPSIDQLGIDESGIRRDAGLHLNLLRSLVRVDPIPDERLEPAGEAMLLYADSQASAMQVQSPVA